MAHSGTPHRGQTYLCTLGSAFFSETMLNFKRSFGDSFIFSSDRKRAIYCEENPLRLSTTAEATSPIELHVPYRGLLFNNEKSKTEEQVGFLYLRCWQDDVLRLRASLDFPSRSPTHPSNTPIFKSNLLPPRLDNNAHVGGARGGYYREGRGMIEVAVA